MALLDLSALLPEVVAGQVDVLPAQGREMLQQCAVHILSRFSDCLHRAFKIDCVSK